MNTRFDGFTSSKVASYKYPLSWNNQHLARLSSLLEIQYKSFYSKWNWQYVWKAYHKDMNWKTCALRMLFTNNFQKQWCASVGSGPFEYPYINWYFWSTEKRWKSIEWKWINVNTILLVYEDVYRWLSVRKTKQIVDLVNWCFLSSINSRFFQNSCLFVDICFMMCASHK